MTDKKIGIGIVGLTPGRSWAATAHVPALRVLPCYELIGVANSSLESAQRAAEACDLPHTYPDAATLARDPAVDLVAITVKVPHHRPLVEAALDALCWVLGDFREVEARLQIRRQTFTIQETGEPQPMKADDQIVISGELKAGPSSAFITTAASAAAPTCSGKSMARRATYGRRPTTAICKWSI